jgi:hypothetical protein
MRSIVNKVKETILLEEQKKSNNKQLKDFQQLLDYLDALGSRQKADYSIPLVDTIGKTTYSVLNKQNL